MTDDAPTVTVLIPALNEERDIRGCLEAVAAQTYPPHLIDVVLVDGCSDDATASVAAVAAAELGLRLEVVENPLRRTSTSLNAGLAHVDGEVVVRLDARSRVQPQYIETCVSLLREDPGIGVAGGAQVASAANEGIEARGIARALRNRWFTGLSRYRRSSRSGPSDTVWMGVFRTDELRTLGGWDPGTALNEDFELNQRFRESGLVVWFESGLRSTYVARPRLRALAVQHFRFGRVKGTWWARGRRPNARQVGLLAVPVVGLGIAAVASRRLGAVPTVALGLVAGLVIDEIGSDIPPATVAERPVAVVAGATAASAWLIGVAVGVAGERLGIEHVHG